MDSIITENTPVAASVTVKLPSCFVVDPLMGFFSPGLNKLMAAYSRGRLVKESITLPVIFDFAVFSCAKPVKTKQYKIPIKTLFFTYKILIGGKGILRF